MNVRTGHHSAETARLTRGSMAGMVWTGYSYLRPEAQLNPLSDVLSEGGGDMQRFDERCHVGRVGDPGVHPTLLW